MKKIVIFLHLIATLKGISQEIEAYRILPIVKTAYMPTRPEYFVNLNPGNLSLNYFSLYSTYKGDSKDFVLGFGTSYRKKYMFFRGDTLFYKNTNNKESKYYNEGVFCILSRDALFDTIYINWVGHLYHSKIFLKSTQYDFLSQDILYEFGVINNDELTQIDDGTFLSGHHYKVLISSFIFSRKIGFFSVAYSWSHTSFFFLEYYPPPKKQKWFRKPHNKLRITE